MIFAGSKKKDTRWSVLLALLINALIILFCFIFLRWKVQDPPPEDQMVELSMADIGFTDTGSNGNDGSPPESQEPVVEETATEEAIVDNTAEVSAPVQEKPSTATKPNVNAKSDEEIQKEKEEKEAKEKADKIAAMMSGKGDGNNSDTGDQGNPDGKIDGKGVFGDGSGWSLAGRNMTGKPKFNGTPKKEGKVQVRITVGKDGKVRTAKVVHSPPTNTSDQSLFDLAIGAAKSAKFNKDDAASINESGTITFVFKVN